MEIRQLKKFSYFVLDALAKIRVAMRESCVYQPLGSTRYFTPHPLPPFNPAFEMDEEIAALYGKMLFVRARI